MCTILEFYIYTPCLIGHFYKLCLCVQFQAPGSALDHTKFSLAYTLCLYCLGFQIQVVVLHKPFLQVDH